MLMLRTGIVGLAVLALCGHASTVGAADEKPFEPIKEADMPLGFPAFTPVGKVEVKDYPVYRKASASGPGEFWTLFMHIKASKVQMTAPVEMEYGSPREKVGKDISMSFLYERPDQGNAGKQANVDVTDVPASTVVSVGCRGERTTAAIEAARQKLLDWLERNKDRYAEKGPLRVMGYNSPFVPRDKNFFEVQIPIAEAAQGPATTTDNP